MFNRKYKKGMADAAKAYQDFGQKQEEALTHILEEVRLGNKSMEEAIKDLGGHLDGLYDHLKSKEKASLYTVYTPFDIKELGEKERLFLLGALLRLTVDKTPNENQQNYIRAIQRYLDVKEPPFGVDPMAIENIEDLPSQKAILQTVLEYLRLQDGDSYDETELQQEFLDSFSVSGKARNEIVNHVELLYSATGAQGLAEKYGFVPEEELVEEEEDLDISYEDFPTELADSIIVDQNGQMLVRNAFETKDYWLLIPVWRAEWEGERYEHIICVDKRDGSMNEVKGFPFKNYIARAMRIECSDDVLAIQYDSDTRYGHIGILDLANMRYSELNDGYNMQLLCTSKNYIVYYEGIKYDVKGNIFVYDVVSKKTKQIQSSPDGMIYYAAADIVDDALYIMGYYGDKYGLYKVTLGNIMALNSLFIGGRPYDDIKVEGKSLGEVLCNSIMRSHERPSGDLFDIKVKGEYLYASFCQGGGSVGYRFNISDGRYKKIVGTIKGDHTAIKTSRDHVLYCDKDNGMLEMLDLNTEDTIKLAEKDVDCLTIPFFKLGKWVYYQSKSNYKTYKVNLDTPLQVELVRKKHL